MLEISLSSAILTLLSRQHLLSANDILLYFKGKGHIYNKTSVYRALDQLVAENKICQHHFSDDENKYELRNQHHAHLVCTSCNSVDTADCSYADPQKIGSFKVDHHHLTLFGLCENCQKKN